VGGDLTYAQALLGAGRPPQEERATQEQHTPQEEGAASAAAPSLMAAQALVEAPLQAEERSAIQTRLGQVTAAAQALRGMHGFEPMLQDLEKEASRLRQRLRRAKPLAQRQVALAEAVERRRAAATQMEEDAKLAEQAAVVARAKACAIRAELTSLEGELLAVNARLVAEEMPRSSAPLRLLRGAVEAAQTGSPISEEWLHQAEALCSVPERAGPAPGMQLWQAMSAPPVASPRPRSPEVQPSPQAMPETADGTAQHGCAQEAADQRASPQTCFMWTPLHGSLARPQAQRAQPY